MKPFTSYLQVFLLAVILSIGAIPASATHYMGVDITYTCLPGGSGCQIRVFHNTYYDCAGAATTPLPGPPFAPTINFTPTTCSQPLAMGAWMFVSYMEVTPICPGFTTQCTTPGATINGVLEARYYRDYDFCSVNCNTYNITWTTCCRNGAITSGASNNGIGTSVTQINLGLTPCNSSPQFNTPPVPYVCAGQPFTFNQGAIDPDGDSIAYSLGPCNTNATGTSVTYNAGFTATQPLGPSWTVSISPTTGDITLVPNPGSILTAVLCVYVEEWRNGILIGQVSRDIQITVITCGTNTPPTITGLTNLSTNAAQTGPYQVRACNLDSICFDIGTADIDLTDSLTLTWNLLLSGQGATFASVANPAIMDTIPGTGALPPSGRFCWRPPSPGNYQFLVQIQDDGCPIIGSNQQTIEIEVVSCRLAPTIATTLVSCFDVQFVICPGGGIPGYNYIFTPGDGSPPINLSSNSCGTYTHSYPATANPQTYNYSSVVTDNSGLVAQAAGAITISNTAIADAGPDLSLCPNQSGTIGTTSQPGYSYTWRGLGGSNLGILTPPGRFVAQPAVALNNTTNGSLTVCYEVEAIDSVGCIAYDTTCVTYNPKPVPSFIASGPVCQGDFSTLTYTGIRRPGIIYDWGFGTGSDVNGLNIGSGQGPHLVNWAPPISGLQTVTLQTTVNGCASDVVSRTVQVNPIPVARFTTVSPICQGSATILTFTGSSSAGATGIWNLNGGVDATGNSTPSSLGPLTVTWNTPGVKIITLQVDDRGCLSPPYQDTVIVNVIPNSTFSAPSTVCIGDSAQFVYTGNGMPNAAYTWNFDGGVFNGAGQGPFRVIWNTPGLKRVCLNVQQNGCFSNQTCINVNVIDAPSVILTPVSDQCFDGNNFAFSYNVSPNSPAITDHIWNFGSSASPPSANGIVSPSNISYLTPGIKTVTLSVAAGGCQADPVSTSFEVIPEPSADFIVSNGVTCSTDSLTFNYVGVPVGPNQTYTWNFGAGANPATSSLPSPGGITYTSGGPKTVSLIVGYKGCTTASARQVTVQQSPLFTAGLDIEYCEGDGGQQIQATTTGGVPTYTYTWSCTMPGNCGLSSPTVEDPFVNPSAIAPDTVTFIGQVTDANGCKSNIDEVTVIIHPKPKVNAGPDIFLCKDAPGEFLQGGLAPTNKALGPFTWQWKDDFGNSPPHGMTTPNDKQPVAYTNPDSTTIYTLVVIDQVTGCTSDVTTVDTASSVTVHVNPRPVANAGKDTVMCLGDLINLQGFASGAGPGYNYAWTPTNTGFISNAAIASPVIGPTQTTTYTLVVTSKGCDSDGDQVTITVHTIPTVSAGDDKVVCLGDSVTLDGSVAGAPQTGTLYDFLWTPSLGINDPTVANPRVSPPFSLNYIVTATSQYGCGSATDTVLVTAEATPIAEMLTRDTTICAGDEINLSATHSFTPPSPGTNVTYEWSPTRSIVGTIFGQNIVARPTQTTIFVVTTSIQGDCPTSDRMIVTVAPKPDAFAAATDSVICSGDATTLLASGDLGSANFVWTPGLSLSDSTAREPIATPAVTTTYSLIVQEGICSTDTSITITVNQTPVVDYFATAPDGCAGHEVSFVENTVNATSYIWDFGDGSPITNERNPSYVYNDPGTYAVTLTAVGTGGCESSLQKVTVNIGDGSLADFASTPSFNEQQSLPDAEFKFEDLSANAVNWLWDFGDGNHSSEQNPLHTYTEAGEYIVTLTVTDANGCVSTIQHGEYLVYNPDIFIPNVFSPNNDGVNEVFEILYTGKEDFSVKVYDRWGKSYFVSESPDTRWDGLAPTGNAAAVGIYYYTIKIGDKAYTGNVTLMR